VRTKRGPNLNSVDMSVSNQELSAHSRRQPTKGKVMNLEFGQHDNATETTRKTRNTEEWRLRINTRETSQGTGDELVEEGVAHGIRDLIIGSDPTKEKQEMKNKAAGTIEEKEKHRQTNLVPEVIEEISLSLLEGKSHLLYSL
jgi:hypothetical protein